jgi:4-hydroxyphenylpyruvate dioxygenase-like putative hemolysin
VNASSGTIHHVELWVPDLDRAAAEWGWLLSQLGYASFQHWAAGRSWRQGQTYVVIEHSPDMSTSEHDRHRPGVNHLAFHAGGRGDVDNITNHAADNGWTLLFDDRHPHAGGPDHYAALPDQHRRLRS